MKFDLKNIWSKIGFNWKSGITVGLVSIPLSISLSVASGSDPVTGIITAFWAGLIASIFGGSNFNIIGPTGALSGLLAVFAFTHGASALSSLAIATGLLILLGYIIKIEKYLVFIPNNTIQGFTLGVAFTIALNQLNFILGLNGLPKHEKFLENLVESLKNINHSSIESIILFIVGFIILFFLLKKFPKVPGSIIVAIFGVIIGLLCNYNIIPLHISTLGDKFANLDMKLFNFNGFIISLDLIKSAFPVAIIAIIETMLSAKIADGMSGTKHNKRKEMLGLSLANIGSGLFGGIPATAALARTSLNIKSGATDKMSQTISAITIALICIFLLNYFKFIPLAIIGSILVFVAFRMVEIEHLEKMFKHDKSGLIIAMVVTIITIEDPMLGILVGAFISLLIYLNKISKGQFELALNDKNLNVTDRIINDKMKIDEDCHTIVYSIKGHLTYIDSQAHVDRFENNIKINYENVIIRLREMSFIDLDGANGLGEIIEVIENKNKKVLISGINKKFEKTLVNIKKYSELKQSGFVFDTTEDAIEFLKNIK